MRVCTRAHLRVLHTLDCGFGRIVFMHRWTQLHPRTRGCSRPVCPAHTSPWRSQDHSSRRRGPHSHLTLVPSGVGQGFATHGHGLSPPQPPCEADQLGWGSGFTDGETEAQRRDSPRAVFFVPSHPTPNSKVQRGYRPRRTGGEKWEALGAPEISSIPLRAGQDREPSGGGPVGALPSPWELWWIALSFSWRPYSRSPLLAPWISLLILALTVPWSLSSFGGWAFSASLVTGGD